MTTTDHALSAFIEAACVPLDSGHASGTLERAETILAAHPEIGRSTIHAAAILGDESAVRHFLEIDATYATQQGGAHSWDALTYLCFSRYLRLDRTRADGFVRTARALLDAGASANTGFYSGDHHPPEFESVLYGASGVAHHAELTRLLLERGADPNDGEVVYHTPESYDNGSLVCLLETGKLTADSLATMLLRKYDWHDHDGALILLRHGADPNRVTHWGFTPLQQAIRRDNATSAIEQLLDHGADPTVLARGQSAISTAAREGRGEVLHLFQARGIAIALDGIDRLLAACAMNDSDGVRSIVAREPDLVVAIVTHGGKLLEEFAGIGNTDGVRQLLDLGVTVDARTDGNGYWGIAKNSTALHVAAWRARHATLEFLLSRGASVDALDGEGRTAVSLAVRACVDSYWTERRTPESVAALLAAGASVSGVDVPTGYAEVDELVRQHRAP